MMHEKGYSEIVLTCPPLSFLNLCFEILLTSQWIGYEATYFSQCHANLHALSLFAFQDLLTNPSKLAKYTNNLKEFQAVRWHDQWKSLVLPIFASKTHRGSTIFNPSRSGIPENFDDIGSRRNAPHEDGIPTREEKKNQ